MVKVEMPVQLLRKMLKQVSGQGDVDSCIDLACAFIEDDLKPKSRSKKQSFKKKGKRSYRRQRGGGGGDGSGEEAEPEEVMDSTLDTPTTTGIPTEPPLEASTGIPTEEPEEIAMEPPESSPETPMMESLPESLMESLPETPMESVSETPIMESSPEPVRIETTAIAPPPEAETDVLEIEKEGFMLRSKPCKPSSGGGSGPKRSVTPQIKVVRVDLNVNNTTAASKTKKSTTPLPLARPNNKQGNLYVRKTAKNTTTGVTWKDRGGGPNNALIDHSTTDLQRSSETPMISLHNLETVNIPGY